MALGCWNTLPNTGKIRSRSFKKESRAGCSCPRKGTVAWHCVRSSLVLWEAWEQQRGLLRDDPSLGAALIPLPSPLHHTSSRDSREASWPPSRAVSSFPQHLWLCKQPPLSTSNWCKSRWNNGLHQTKLVTCWIFFSILQFKKNTQGYVFCLVVFFGGFLFVFVLGGLLVFSSFVCSFFVVYLVWLFSLGWFWWWWFLIAIEQESTFSLCLLFVQFY